MEIKKAIKQFERWEESGWIQGEVPNTYMLILAKRALEKQTPKTPLFEDNGGYPEYFEHWLACPICDEAIPEYTAENNTWCYCLGCGQKLDWTRLED